MIDTLHSINSIYSQIVPEDWLVPMIEFNDERSIKLAGESKNKLLRCEYTAISWNNEFRILVNELQYTINIENKQPVQLAIFDMMNYGCFFEESVTPYASIHTAEVTDTVLAIKETVHDMQN